MLVRSIALAAVLLCALSGCSNDAPSSTASKPKPAQVRTVPHVGTVVISHLPLLVIRDRATNGRRLYLAGLHARECLSYLKANPAPSKRDVHAACPGAIGSVPASKNQSPESIEP